MKALIITILFSSVLTMFYGQGEAEIWYFGKFAGIDFSSGSPVVLTDGDMYVPEGCATLSDQSGNLLLYTDGITVWDAAHDTMQNGKGLLGSSSSTQSAVVVPQPGSSRYIYIFSSDCAEDLFVDGVTYSKVDMNANSGLGVVMATEKNQTLLAPACERVTAVKNSNGTDYWVIVHKYNDNKFYAYAITSSGLNTTPVITQIGLSISSSDEGRGCMKTSPDGTRLAVAIDNKDTVQVFDFDASTGQLSSPISLVSPDGAYGLEFSPDNNILYGTNRSGGGAPRLFQWDLSQSTESAINSSRTTIHSGINSRLSSLQLAPDEKIYVCDYKFIVFGAGYEYLSCIENPNTVGVGCNFVQEAVFLDPLSENRCIGEGLPCFVQTFVSPVPVELTSFDGQNNGISNILQWETATETNNNFFTIERSKDEVEFQNIGIVDGSGNSQSTTWYNFTDENPGWGTTYYRLKQTDFDGKSYYSPVIAVAMNVNLENIEIFPTAVSDILTIKINSLQTKEYELEIMDITGRLIEKQSIMLDRGENEFSIDISKLSKGKYFIRNCNKISSFLKM